MSQDNVSVCLMGAFRFLPSYFLLAPVMYRGFFKFLFEVSSYRLVNVLRIALLRKTKEKMCEFFFFFFFSARASALSTRVELNRPMQVLVRA